MVPTKASDVHRTDNESHGRVLKWLGGVKGKGLLRLMFWPLVWYNVGRYCFYDSLF